jgi:hypothetical protein
MESFKSINLCGASHLSELDLSHVHLHSREGFGRALSSLKFLTSLHLPCCGLSIEIVEKKTSFKRIFEDDDGSDTETNSKTSLANEAKVKSQLEYITQVNTAMKSFSISRPPIGLSCPTDKYFVNCKSISYDDLMEITKFKELRHLSLSNFKLLGKPSFDTFIKSLSKVTQLESLSLINISALNTFKCQNMIYKELKEFQNLKSLEIELDGLMLTKVFFESMSELKRLDEVILRLKSLDLSVFKSWASNASLVKSHSLRRFVLSCDNKVADITTVRQLLEQKKIKFIHENASNNNNSSLDYLLQESSRNILHYDKDKKISRLINFYG